MEKELTLNEEQKLWHGSFRSYAIGFTASLLLTGLSFLLVAAKLVPVPYLGYTVAALALVQAVIQLKYFLHLGQEGKPYWETFIFMFMVLILLIVVLGSLWIMYDLNQRTMNMTMPTPMTQTP